MKLIIDRIAIPFALATIMEIINSGKKPVTG
jgi:hypothetical protein